MICALVLISCGHMSAEKTDARLEVTAEAEELICSRFAFFSDTWAADAHAYETHWPRRSEFALEADPEARRDEWLRQLRREIASLQDGHTAVFPDVLGSYPGIRLRWIAGYGVYVEAFHGGDELKPGDRVMAVTPADSTDDPVPRENWRRLFDQARRYVTASSREAEKQFAADFLIAAAVMDSDHAYIGFRIIREGGELTRFIEPRSRQEDFPAVQQPYGRMLDWGSRTAAYIAVPTMAYLDDINRIDELINAFLDADALIIDLRGNSGGNSAVSEFLIARFALQQEFSFRIVCGVTGAHQRTVGPPAPRGQQFDGPAAVLTDHEVFSAAHHFAALCRCVKQSGAREQPLVLVGGKTGGGSGISEAAALTEDLTLRYAASVFVDPAGMHTERGIVPDIDVLSNITPDALRDHPVLRMLPADAFDRRWRDDPFIAAALEFLGGLL